MSKPINVIPENIGAFVSNSMGHLQIIIRKANNPNDYGAGGKLGEILLYLFLENKLDAPKLLSKVELKTSGNQYVFGSDGVHLFQLDNKNFQLILGESKIKGVL